MDFKDSIKRNKAGKGAHATSGFLFKNPYHERIRGVASDVDGTLIDTFKVVSRAIQLTIEHYKLKPVTIQQIRSAYNGEDSFKKMFRDLNVPEELLTDKGDGMYPFAVKCWFDICPDVERKDPAPLIPGADKMLKALSSAGLPLFLVSSANSKRINSMIERLGIKAFFAEENIFAEKSRKSSALREIKSRINSSRLLYLGDMISDCIDSMEAGVNFGALYHKYSYSGPEAFAPYESHPLFIKVPSLLAVPRIVLNGNTPA